jgi:methylmalonyl-CoA mutase N-terminal domain/subunit
VAKLRASRNQADVTGALAKLKSAAQGSDNVLYPMKDALRANATLGEVSDVLREVFGVYQPS